MQKPKISMRKIAELADVSVATVSRAVNHTGRMSDETRNRILKIMQENDYPIAPPPLDNQVVHNSAKNNGNDKIIGIIIRNFNSEIRNQIATEISKYFTQNGYAVYIVCADNSPSLEMEHVTDFYSRNISGLVILTPRNPELFTMLNPSVPTVAVDYCLSTQLHSELCTVTSDYIIGGKLAAEELLKKGCTSPLIMDIGIQINDRSQSFYDTFAENGIIIPDSHRFQLNGLPSRFEEAQELISYLIAKNDTFDSIFAINDWGAYGCLVSLRNLNYKVPEDVKIIGFDGSDIARYCDQPITTIMQNVSALAVNACELLKSQINNQPISNRHVIVPLKLLPGKTT